MRKAHQIGLLNQVDWPYWIKVVVALLVLDLAIWAQHLASHKMPVFWRLHQVHHADRDIDVTTAVRFHPVEIGLSMLWKIVVVVPLGASPLAVFLFEVILNACAMFNHANIALPAWLDRDLAALHRHARHASRASLGAAARARFAITASICRCGTGCSAPTRRSRRPGHQGMTIGLTPYQSEAPTRFGWSYGCRSGRSPQSRRGRQAIDLKQGVARELTLGRPF